MSDTSDHQPKLGQKTGMSISSAFKKHGRWKGCVVILLYVLLSLLELFLDALYLLFCFAQDAYIKMAKKRPQKKRRSSRAKSIARLPIKELPNVGQNYLRQGKFAEAIKIFRRLSQESEEEKWAESFRSSFQGRISQLAAKGMHKEALVIFHNMETQFPDQASELQGQHILLLIHADQLDKARQFYEQTEDTLTKQQKQLIDETFAALLLSGNDKLAQKFPSDSPLRSQFSHAQQALSCYARGQDSEALEHLQGLPFRSPYKNFCMALKGILAFHDTKGDKDKARVFFDKIHADSPFFLLISPYLHVLKDAKAKESDRHKDNSRDLGKTEKKAVQQLQGLDKAKISFLASLKNNATTPPGFLRCLFNAGTCLDDKVLKQVSYQLLAHDLSFLRMYEKKFGKIKDDFEQARLEALALEIKDESPSIPERWRQACLILSKRKNPDDALKIALMHRHIATWIANIRANEYRCWDDQQEELEKSLDYDPDDKVTWLRVHQLLAGSPAEQYRWVNRMLKQFPKEPDIIFLGAEAAVGRSAFKKASRLAGELLEIDPINTKVRELLINAHINHAHKLTKQEKYALACKECGHATTFGRGNADQGRIEITHGLIELLQGKEKEGQALVDKGESRYEHEALARVQVRMDAEQLPIPPAWKKKFTTRLKAVVKDTPKKDELLQIVPLIVSSNNNKAQAWKGIRAALLPYLKKGADLALHKDEFVMICQAWQRLPDFALLHAYGKKAAQHWPDVPLFKYYLVVGKSENGKKRLTGKDIEELEDASHMAMRQKDSATEKLIDDFLGRHASFGFSGGPPIGMLAELLEQEMFGDDDGGGGGKKKPSKEDIEKLFDIFGDL